MDITSAIIGAGAGITYALTSFAKKKDQEFDYIKFGTTIIIGAIAGASQGFLNLEVAGAYNYMISLGTVPIVENILKFAKRKVWDRFVSKEE